MTEAAPTTQAEQEDAVRDYVGRLRSWGENDPDPDYFIGDVLNCLLLDCGHASVAFVALLAQCDQLAADLRKATVQISELAQAKGEAEGRLRASEMAGVVEGWREQNERLAADLRKAREALKVAQSALAMLTEPKEIRSTSVANAWAVAVDAELKCRRALTPDHTDAGGTAKGDDHAGA